MDPYRQGVNGATSSHRRRPLDAAAVAIWLMDFGVVFVMDFGVERVSYHVSGMAHVGLILDAIRDC